MIATKIKVGNILIIDGELARVTRTDHITPGKGNACMQVKMKNIRSGQNIEKRFRSSENVERAVLEQRKLEYLYSDPDGFHFMNHETYETISLPADFVGDNKYFLVENMEVEIEYYEEEALGVLSPMTVDLKVVETSPEIKNATASDSKKPATLETGLVVNVPAFIKEGEYIRVKTETKEYLERAKK
jgi:elongation factor P